jgi:hypothetical protein
MSTQYTHFLTLYIPSGSSEMYLYKYICRNAEMEFIYLFAKLVVAPGRHGVAEL